MLDIFYPTSYPLTTISLNNPNSHLSPSSHRRKENGFTFQKQSRLWWMLSIEGNYISHNMSKTLVVEPSECVPCNHAHFPTPIFSPTLSLYPLRMCVLSPHSSVYLPSPSWNNYDSPHSFFASWRLHCLSCSNCDWSLSILWIPQTEMESSHHLYVHACICECMRERYRKWEGTKKEWGVGEEERKRERERGRSLSLNCLHQPRLLDLRFSLNALTQIHLNATWYPGLDPGLAKHRLKKKKKQLSKFKKV